MAEFNLKAFTDSIRQNIYDNFPYENDTIKMQKHLKRPLHIRDIALGNPYVSMEGTCIFEIGDEYSEEYYPYYHILEDSQVIRKRGRGTKGSRGSQAEIKELGKRDYGRISFNGKTYSREYAKNVRGQRSRLGTATRVVVGSDGKAYRVNPNANYYANKHYQYIERTLNMVLPWIAQEYGLRMGRTEITSLELDYESQEYNNLINNVFGSFEE